MNKKILTSLLMTPLALSGFADVVVQVHTTSNEGWTQAGITDSSDPIFTENGVNCSIQGASIKTTQTLYPGSYTLEFTNDVNIKVEVNGVKVTDNTFTVEGNESQDVTIVISADNAASGFSFTALSIKLNFDFSAAYTSLLSSYNNLPAFGEEIASDEDIKAQYDALTAESAALDATIEKLNTADDQKSVYEENNLWDFNSEDPSASTDKITIALTTLKSEIEAFNESNDAAVEDEKAEAANADAYDTLSKALDGDLDALTKAIEKTQSDLKAVEGQDNAAEIETYVNGIISQMKGVQGEYKALQEKLDAEKDAGTVVENQEALIEEITSLYNNNVKDFVNNVNADGGNVYIKDATAYYAMQTLPADVEAAYQKAQSTIINLKGVEGYENAFEALQPTWQEGLSNLYATESQKVTEAIPTEVAGAAAAQATAQTAVTAAKKALADYASELATKVAAQNDLMEAALAKFTDLPDDLTAFPDLAKAVAETKNEIESAYEQLNLTEQEVNDISFGGLGDLFTEYKTLQDNITKLNAAEDGQVNGVFNSTMKAIEDAINSLAENTSEEAITTITKAVQATNANVKNLLTALENAHKSFEAYTTAYDALETGIDKIELLDGVEKAKIIENAALDGVSFTDVQKDYADYEAKVNTQFGADSNPEEVFTTITDIAKQLSDGEETFVQNTDLMLLAYADAATDANKAVVTKLYNDVKASAEPTAEGDAEPVNYYGYDKVQTSLTTIKTDLDKVELDTSGDDYVAAANACYAELQKIMESLDGVDGDITTYKDNQKWADGQLAALNAITSKDIVDLFNYNESTSWDPAKEYYEGVITDYMNNQTALETEINTALEKGLELTADDQAALNTKVENFVNGFNGLHAQILANQDAYKELLEVAETTRQAIQKVQNQVKDLEANDNEDVQDFVNKANKQVEELFDQLNEINNDMTSMYGNGTLASKQSQKAWEYNMLALSAEQTSQDITNDFGSAVEKANNEWLDIWKATYNDLRSEYKQTINTFNLYNSTNITNVDFFKYLVDNVKITDQQNNVVYNVLGNHEPVYKFSALITALNQKVIDFVAENNKEEIVITQKMYDEATADASTYSSEMEELVMIMEVIVKDCAETYYNQQIATATAAINAAQDKMANAGIETDLVKDALKDANDLVAQVKESLTSIGEDATTYKYTTTVNTACNELAELESTIDYQAAAVAEWNLAYTADETEVTALAEKVAGFTHIQADNENLVAFNEAKEAFEALAGTENTENLINVLAEKLEDLNTLMEAMRNAENALETENQAVQDAIDATTTLNEQVADLTTQYEALMSFADGLAGQPTIGDVPATLKSISNEIKNSSDIVADEASIQSQLDAVKASIEAGYTSLVSSENTKLNNLMTELHTAFNNAAAKQDWDNETIIEKNEEIEGFQTAIDNLYNENKDGVKDPAAYKAAAQELEKKVSDELLNLQSSVNPDTSMADVLTALNEAFGKAATGIAEGEAALGDLVKNDYAPKYAELTNDLDAIKAEVEAKGSAVVLYQSNFEAKIQSVEAKLTALNAEAKAAQEAAAAKKAIEETTETNVAALETELTAAEAEIEAAKNQVAQWNVPEYAAYLNGLDSRVQAIKDEIASEGTISDTNTDGLTDAEKTEISEAIASLGIEADYYVLQAATSYANDAETATNAAIAAAYKALADASVVNSSTISSELSQQSVALEDARNELSAALAAVEGTDHEANEAKVAAYEAYADAAKAIQETVAGLSQEISDNTYVLGDVDGNGGTPNIADLQTLIGWIGQGYTLEDIKELKGAAIAAAADINGSGTLNIADVTALNQLIMYGPANSPARIVAARSTASEAVYGIARSSESEGNRTYALTVNNTGKFIAAQVDVIMPAGMTLVDAELTARASGHELYMFDNGNGRYRIIIISMNNSAFEGDSGELVTLHTEGIGTPEVFDMIFSTPEHIAVEGHKADTSFLDSIIEGAHNMKESIYNAAGQTLRSVQRGINIIRNSDGTTTKELRK